MKLRWLVIAIVGVLVAGFVALALVVPLTSEQMRQQVIATLAERLDAEVELAALQVRFLPGMHAKGSGLVVRHKGRRDVPPIISVKTFSVDGALLGLWRKHVAHVELDGLDIEIPPDHANPARPSATPARAGENKPGRDFIIDDLVSTDARLVMIPREEGKSPKVWAIHRLLMHNVGAAQAMPFEATLTNGVPPGEIGTKGRFGPWQSEDPGQTPLDGTFTFDRADLGVFHGISGILSAHGTFGGLLERIDIHGETETPQFTVAVGGHPVPLHTKYHAVVDGTNGDTLLERIDGSFLNTSLVAKGAVVETPGKKGRTVTLDVTMDKARLEDVLQLAVKAPEAADDRRAEAQHEVSAAARRTGRRRETAPRRPIRDCRRAFHESRRAEENQRAEPPREWKAAGRRAAKSRLGLHRTFRVEGWGARTAERDVRCAWCRR